MSNPLPFTTFVETKAAAIVIEGEVLETTPVSVFMNISPGMSLADTAAQRGVIGLQIFRAL